MKEEDEEEKKDEETPEPPKDDEPEPEPEKAETSEPEKAEPEPEPDEEEDEPPPGDNVDELKLAFAAEQKEVSRLSKIIKGLVDVRLATLGDKDKDLVLELAGKKPDAQLTMLVHLEKAGKIVCNTTAHSEIATPPPVDRTRVAGGEPKTAKPKTMAEAASGFKQGMMTLQAGKKPTTTTP